MEQYLTTISGFIIGGIVGVIVGFTIGAKRDKSDQINSLTWTQVIGSALTAGYLISGEPDPTIMLALIALIPSETIGLGIARAVEKRR